MTMLELDSPKAAQSSKESWPSFDGQSKPCQSPDHYSTRDGEVFAGIHLIADFWDASHLNDLKIMEAAMREAADAAGATLLHIHLHHFSETGGISGVAVLAESHLSVHTWPERDFAAFDVFMCGDTQPELAIDVLREALSPEKVDISEHRRGRIA